MSEQVKAASTDLQETQDLIRGILTWIRMIPPEDCRAVLARFERSETIAPFVDPTFYLRNMRDITAFARDLRKFVEFRGYLEVRK